MSWSTARLSKVSPIRNWTPMPKSSTIILECEDILECEEKGRSPASSKGRNAMKMGRNFSLATLAGILAAGTAQAEQTVKIGVLSDMSSLYADIGGPGSITSAKMAIADFAKDHPGLKVEIVTGDHLNKPDIG